MTLSDGSQWSGRDWSRTAAVALAKRQIRFGAAGACVQRARMMPQGYQGPWDKVACYGRGVKLRPEPGT